MSILSKKSLTRVSGSWAFAAIGSLLIFNSNAMGFMSICQTAPTSPGCQTQSRLIQVPPQDPNRASLEFILGPTQRFKFDTGLTPAQLPRDGLMYPLHAAQTITMAGSGSTSAKKLCDVKNLPQSPTFLTDAELGIETSIEDQRGYLLHEDQPNSVIDHDYYLSQITLQGRQLCLFGVRFRNPKLIVDAPQISLPIYTVEDADRVLMGAEMVGLPQSFAYRADGRVTTTIKNTGGKITACSIEPALPPHMYMSLKKNCSPMGYPGGLKMATNYILTASNAGGSSRVEFTLNPDILNPFPVFLGKKYVLRRGVKTLIRPRNFGGTIHECTMGYSSVLPEGLKLDPKNCYIYGIPTKLTGPVSPIPNAEGEWEGRYDINAYGLPFPATPCRGDFSKSPVPNNLPDYCTCRIAQLRDFPANAEKCKDVWPHGDQVNSWNVEMSENGDLRFLKWRSGSLQIEVID